MPKYTSSRLLIDEPPLQILPKLAVRIGLNEAIVVQQLHYWLQTNPHVHGGQPWVYNTYPQWQKNFPFWSVDTIKRTILRLEKEGIIETTDEFNTSSSDRTKWYTINYGHDVFDMCRAESPDDEGNLPHSEQGNLPHSTYTETTTETTVPDRGNNITSPMESKPKRKTSAPETETNDDFESWWSVYPRKVKKADARKAFEKINPDPETLARMIADVQARSRSRDWNEEGGKFIPHPTTYLNQQRWEDEDDPAPSVTPLPGQHLSQNDLRKLPMSAWKYGVYEFGSAGAAVFRKDWEAGTLPQLDGSRP